MLIVPAELSRRYGVKASGVLHVGAHEAEESADYSSQGWGPVIWVEMLPEKFALLKKRFPGDSKNTVLQAACWDIDGAELPVFRADNGQSSSLLRPELHLTAHPGVRFAEEATIRTSRLDTILPKTASFDFINLDVQGAELRVLRGLGTHLDHVKWAYLEVNERRLYDGCALRSEIDQFMQERGFVRVALRVFHGYGWGDALYVRQSILSSWTIMRHRMFGRFSQFWRAPVSSLAFHGRRIARRLASPFLYR